MHSMESINPFTGLSLGTYRTFTSEQTIGIVKASAAAFYFWRQQQLMDRCNFIQKLGDILSAEKEHMAQLITAEMGKPIRESRAEVEKCVLLCRHYANPANADLDPLHIKTEASESFVSFEPLGVILAIMPWNFPCWQVLRFAVPNLVAGNTTLLKHAPNVFGCALAIEELFVKAGFPANVFRALIIHHDEVENVIAHPFVKGVTITGSERAGKAVAALAGKYLKKSVMELGGSDPFIVLADADLANTCLIGLKSRMMNAGQVCISAKRFIVEDELVDDFIAETISLMENLKVGDPLDTETDIGPMARPDLVDQIEKQVNDSISMGASLMFGGKRHEKYPTIFLPTLLTNVRPEMPVVEQETFGPVSVVIPFNTTDEAIRIANNTRFGLAASIWTEDVQKAKKMAQLIDAGAVFVNSMTKSDPRLPFGGVKNSGYGRELSSFGIREFLNIKTNWID
jgi:succinate-semialdehyde dehydrogenase / glutarate-semialdehyde dehydrogenase